MSIIRGSRPKEGYYVLRNEISGNKKLSWAARGLLVYLLSKPDNWKVSIANLVNETAESGAPLGRDGVYKLINQLIEAGYILRTQGRESGKMSSIEYIVCETVSPLTASPLTDLPDTVKPTLINTDSLEKTEDIQAPPRVAKTEVDDIWKHVTPEGRKRSSKDEVATAYSKAIKKLNHSDIIAGVRAYYEDCAKTGCGHMAPHRLLWDSRAKKPGRVINYVPKQKTDKVSLDDLRAWVKMRELSHVFVWPESKAGMDEQTARQLLEAS